MEPSGEKQQKASSKHGDSGSGSGAVRKSRRRSGERSRSRTRRRSSSGNSASGVEKGGVATKAKSPTEDGPSVKKKQLNLNANPPPVTTDHKQNGSTSEREMRRISKLDDPLEKQAIREKLRAKPGVRREGNDASRAKGPMVARPPSSPSPIDGSSSASSTPPPPSSQQASSSGCSAAPSSSVRRPRSFLPQRSQSPSAHNSRESPFTKQVVNRIASPTSPRLPRHRGYVSPSGSRPNSPTSGHRRAASPTSECLFTLAVGVLKKRVERALHARLFLLSQIGPNSFLIGGDSPDHKYKVTIGSQNCNCGKGPFCVHLLFVMLRVFKLSEEDNLLWQRTLKNFEVELLFAKYEAMKKKKLKQSPSTSSGQRSRRSSHSPSMSNPPRPGSPCPSTGSSDQREDEDLCPICLLDMVEGESLVVCRNGCHNKLHHHCVAIWEEECKRQQEPMVCPLCRAVWSADDQKGDTDAPRGGQSPTPDEMGGEEEGSGETSRLETFQQKKDRWEEAFDADIVECMFSRDWCHRETTLHTLCQALSAKLKRDENQVSESHNSEECEERFQDDIVAMESGFDMVAMACSDPVYKVYVAALRALRVLLMCIHCCNEDQQAQIRVWLQPVMAAILVKCADGNRRTSQLSVSAMLELARGDAGELAISKELSCSSCIGLGGLDYILSCLISDNLGEESRQHLLGCLCVLEKVVLDFPERFAITDSVSEVEKESKIECLVSIAKCVSSHLNNSHQRISRISKKVVVNVTKVLVADSSAFERLWEIMRTLECRELGIRMQRRLQKILDEYERALEAEDEGERGEEASRHGHKSRDASGVCEDARDGRRSRMTSHQPEDLECDGASSPRTDTRSSSRPHLKEQMGACPGKSPHSNYNQECTNISDISDLSASPTTPCDPITFKTEVTSTPKKRGEKFEFAVPGVGPHNCKDEVEAEEAEALAIAMEASMHTQGPLPKVPGLKSPRDGEVIVKIHHDANADDVDGDKKSKQYIEGMQWVKGALLGTGAFSSCYMARDTNTGTLMAVKQISFYRNKDEDQEKTMRGIVKEIKLMGTFDHPHIVRLIGATEHGGHFNVFVEWMPGGAVSTLLKNFGAFSSAVTVKYVHQICLGLAYLHDKCVIHRDLKGANLLLDSTGHHLRIADLGTAAKMDGLATRTDEFKGQFMGTIAFMAPEVLRGEQYGRSCDIWSLGCCIIEMCTTKPPWNASAISNHLQLLFKIASANGPPPVPENLSPALRDIALRCMETAPSARPSVVELLKHAAFRQITE